MLYETTEKGFVGEGLYREHILDHYQHPRNFGHLAHCDFSHKELNPVCGDTLQFELALDAEGRVFDVRFSGNGCAISMASASLLSDEIKGKSRDEIDSLSRNDVMSLLGIKLGPVRLKCAMLALDTIKNAFAIHEKYGKKGGN